MPIDLQKAQQERTDFINFLSTLGDSAKITKPDDLQKMFSEYKKNKVKQVVLPTQIQTPAAPVNQNTAQPAQNLLSLVGTFLSDNAPQPTQPTQPFHGASITNAGQPVTSVPAPNIPVEPGKFGPAVKPVQPVQSIDPVVQIIQKLAEGVGSSKQPVQPISPLATGIAQGLSQDIAPQSVVDQSVLNQPPSVGQNPQVGPIQKGIDKLVQDFILTPGGVAPPKSSTQVQTQAQAQPANIPQDVLDSYQKDNLGFNSPEEFANFVMAEAAPTESGQPILRGQQGPSLSDMIGPEDILASALQKGKEFTNTATPLKQDFQKSSVVDSMNNAKVSGKQGFKDQFQAVLGTPQFRQALSEAAIALDPNGFGGQLGAMNIQNLQTEQYNNYLSRLLAGEDPKNIKGLDVGGLKPELALKAQNLVASGNAAKTKAKQSLLKDVQARIDKGVTMLNSNEQKSVSFYRSLAKDILKSTTDPQQAIVSNIPLLNASMIDALPSIIAGLQNGSDADRKLAQQLTKFKPEF